MMVMLFDPKLVYPSDSHGGRYIELEGDVVQVDDEPLSRGEYGVSVRTEHGTFRGYTVSLPPGLRPAPKVSIRIYDCGGGWYPDNQVMGPWVPAPTPDPLPAAEAMAAEIDAQMGAQVDVIVAAAVQERKLLEQQAAERLEEAYWLMDYRIKQGTSDRDAFKTTVRKLLRDLQEMHFLELKGEL